MELSSDGDPKGKRKLVIEDASGPAWGAHSFAANKNTAINKSMQESGKDPGFGDFGRYFSEKKRKLRDQYQQNAAAPFLGEMTGTAAPNELVKTESTTSEDKKKRLFQGVSIFVDGFTTPTHQELRFLMMNHGGGFENYFSSQQVTHVICSTLPDSKIMNPRLLSRGLPIVKPEWIVDSIKENRLLSWESYQLERLAYSHPHQKTLAASFSARKLDDASDFCKGASERIPQNTVDVETETLVNPNNQMVPRATAVFGESGRTAMPKPQQFQHVQSAGDGANVEAPLPDGPSVNRPHDSSRFEQELVSGANEQVLRKGVAPNLPVAQKQVNKKPTPGRGHSTLDDPDFVQSYFKNSRLHFIGTWRTRYQNLVNAGSFGEPNQVMNALPVAFSSGKPVIIHLDMDCFFVSVVVRNQPGLIGKPVAVCHSNSAQGTGEISSANYPARAYGIKAGMFVRSAKALCPDLAIVPYDFPAYEQVADAVYSILHRHSSIVQAVSCDEAFLDVTGHPEPAGLASKIREEIFQATQCTASTGIAENLLLARLATKKAKPNGQFFIQPHEVKEFMATLPLDELPGVGWTLREKLHGNGLYNCADLQALSKEALQQVYGAKTGVMLWSYAQGIDDREVQPAQERKSIGAEVNWGVRFLCMDDAQQFLVTLSSEVASRMQKCSSSGRTITLKVKRRKEGVGEPVKFMGCGVCDNLSRSETVGYPTNSAEVLLRIGRQLFASLHLDVQEVRGVGLQVSRLVSTNTGTRMQHKAFESWLPTSSKVRAGKEVVNQITGNVQSVTRAEAEETDPHNGSGPSSPWNEKDYEDPEGQGGKSDLIPQDISDSRGPNDVQLQHQTSSERKTESNPSLELPPFSQIDQSVLECLPADIVAEIREANKAQEERRSREHVDRKAGAQPQVTSSLQKRNGGKLSSRKTKGETKPRNNFLELPPHCQLDPSVLDSLPEDILAELNHAYAQNLKQKSSKNQFPKPLPTPPTTTPGDADSLKEKTLISSGDNLKDKPLINTSPNNSCGSMHSLREPENIYTIPNSNEDSARHFGRPQSVKKTAYEDYHTMLWDTIEGINSGKSRKSLSSGLLSLSSYIHEHDGRDLEPVQHFIHQCFELIIGHVRAIAPKDLEEVHLILLYLKRLGSKCRLWRVVQELTISASKGIISELYGGQLNID